MEVGQTVYADVLFLINFSMDFLVLYICAKLTRRRLDAARSALGAAIGGAYGILTLLLPQNGIVALVCDTASLLAICAVAFLSRGDRARDFFGRCALFAGVCAILGGIMSALYSMLNRSGLATLEPDGGDDISVWLFALIAALGGAAAVAGGKRMRRISAAKQSDIEIGFEDKLVSLRAMTDTGNMLADPLSGKGVAICELDAVRDIFPRELVEYWERGDVTRLTRLSPRYAARLRYIPAKSAIDGRPSVLAAIAPDVLRVVGNGKSVGTDLLVAPVPRRLSAGESRALLPPGII